MATAPLADADINAMSINIAGNPNAPKFKSSQPQELIFLDLDDAVEDTPKREPFEIPDDAPELPFFMAGNELSYIKDLDKQEYVHDNYHEPAESLEMANLISSKIKGSNKHKVILDLDFDAFLVDSSTPGHKHLYLDIDLNKDQMDELLRTLTNVGIIAQGNLSQWDKFKAQFLRLPWIKKGPGATDDDEDPKE